MLDLNFFLIEFPYAQNMQYESDLTLVRNLWTLYRLQYK